MQAHDALDHAFRITPAQKSALNRLGIASVRDLLYHFPVRYSEAGAEARSGALFPGGKVTLVGTLSKLKAKKLWRSKRPATEGYFEDASGRVKVLWFNQPYIASMHKESELVRLTGVVAGKESSVYIANPEIIRISPEEAAVGLFTKDASGSHDIFPVYPESKGVTSRWFFHALQKVFDAGADASLPDALPEAVRAAYHLPDIATALRSIHRPKKLSHAEAARKRFAFEEIFSLQTLKMLERARRQEDPAFRIPDASARTNTFLDSLSVTPTRAQKRSAEEIASDLEGAHPMARLLEGDVGSGKTMVAAAASYAAVTSTPANQNFGTLQVAYMAPTEILAAQHFESFIEYFRHLPISIALITGSGCKKFPSKTARLSGQGGSTTISRSQLLKWVANGEIAMVVGTHALIQKAVRFKHLALCIVDEQHRFGTNQRHALAKKGDAPPHFLSMTATPIPRTLALTIYGDLDLSVIDELPPGRAKIETRIIRAEERAHAYEAMRTELTKGRQAYVICPRIEEPDPAKWNALQAKSAKAEAKRLAQDVFPEYTIGLLHGGMKKEEKEKAMLTFSRGETRVLVATSVVEVGVNVPNATVIMIEGAERFGLSQLHQLRGRVQRSSHQPYCFLLPETTGDTVMKRLRALETSSDGFALAEKDLEARGAGDLYGASQWGVSDIGMQALQNPRLIAAAREEAARIIVEDPTLSKHAMLRERVERLAPRAHGE